MIGYLLRSLALIVLLAFTIPVLGQDSPNWIEKKDSIPKRIRLIIRGDDIGVTVFESGVNKQNPNE